MSLHGIGVVSVSECTRTKTTPLSIPHGGLRWGPVVIDAPLGEDSVGGSGTPLPQTAGSPATPSKPRQWLRSGLGGGLRAGRQLLELGGEKAGPGPCSSFRWGS